MFDTLVKQSNASQLRSIYERRSKEALINYIIEQKISKAADIELWRLKQMSKEELINYIMELHHATLKTN